MNALPAFSAKLAVLLAALATILFSLSLILGSHEDPMAGSDSRAGPGAFSTSSLGYAGLYDLLGRFGWKVARTGDPENRDKSALLVLAEPERPAHPKDAVAVDPGGKTFVVLPKWKPIRDPGRSRWIAGVKSLPPSEVDSALAAVAPGAKAARRRWPASWKVNEIGVEPSGTGAAQTIVSDALRPIVASESGVLVGEMETDGGTIWILADPDVMANHGLVDGDNAAFMLALFNRMTDGGTLPVVFDESVHGYHPRRRSPARLLFEFPFVIAAAIAFVAAVLLALAGAARFGMPDRAESGRGFGKAGLVESTARLMAYAGHEAPTLKRYVRMQVDMAADALHAPPGLDERGRVAWLDRLSRDRVPGASCGEILEKARTLDDKAGLMQCAMDIRRWREAVATGTGKTAGGPHQNSDSDN